MPQVSAEAVVRDVLAELEEVPTGSIVRAAAQEAVRRIGKEKVKEMARRIAGEYIDALNLPLGGAIARRKALPAVDAFVEDALKGLE
jgi:hypothetical protein